MNIVFNELSINDYEIDNDVIDRIEEFVSFINLLYKNGMVDYMFVSTKSIYDNSKDSQLVKWLKDSKIDSNNKQYMRTILNKAANIDENRLSGEFIPEGDVERIGIGCTFLFEYDPSGKLVSLSSRECWKQDVVNGIYRYLNSEGELIETKELLENIYSGSSVDDIKCRLVRKVYEDISSGQDLWERREELFPNLIFCENVKKQLYDNPEKYHIIRIMEKLSRMQEYFSHVHNSYSPHELGMDARTESESVKKNKELSMERCFKLPDGRKELFYDHVGFTGKFCGRIHFYPDVKNMRCYIGYIGQHLHTKKY